MKSDTESTGNTSRKAIAENVGCELFNSLQDPLLLVNSDGIIKEVNPALLSAAKKEYDEIIGRGICEIIHGGRWPHIECPLEEFLRTCTPRIEDTRLPGLGGEYSLSIVPITKGEQEEQLILLIARLLNKEEIRKVDSIRTAQLAAIGELAAGVAHEVNNPINGIINFAQLLLDDCEENSSQQEVLQRIVNEGERIATIIYNLLSFSRETTDAFAMVDLNEVVRDSMSLVAHQLKYDGIHLITKLHEPPRLILGNHSQLQQVVLNLISNCRYALNERYPDSVPEKKIEIHSTITHHEERKYFRLSVRDYGTGIPQSILDKMFEPFFTSKPAAKGSGLGLSISYGIVSNHNGFLRVDSILNQYTDLILEIPLAESS